MTESSGKSDRGEDAVTSDPAKDSTAGRGAGTKAATARRGPAETTTTNAAGAGGGGRNRSLSTARIRGTVARVVWVACLLIALVLAAAAFSFALDANAENNLVKAVRDMADFFDVGLFDLDNPVWAADASEPNADVKTALANYGAAAVGYLVVGRLLERIIRP